MGEKETGSGYHKALPDWPSPTQYSNLC